MKPIKVGDLVRIKTLLGCSDSLYLVIDQHREYTQLFDLYEIKTSQKFRFIHREVINLVQTSKEECVEP